jgi:hypothetical protein
MVPPGYPKVDGTKPRSGKSRVRFAGIGIGKEQG